MRIHQIAKNMPDDNSISFAAARTSHDWFRMGYYAHSCERDPEAMLLYEYALRAEPAYTPARFNLGLVLQRMRRLRESERCFRAILQNDPRHYKSELMLGVLHCQYGSILAAQRHLQRSAEMNLVDPTSFEHIAHVYEYMGLPRLADEARDRGRKLRRPRSFLLTARAQMGRRPDSLNV